MVLRKSCALNRVFASVRASNLAGFMHTQLLQLPCIDDKQGGVGQCVCAEHDVRSWHADIGEDLRSAGNRGRHDLVPIYATTPFDMVCLMGNTEVPLIWLIAKIKTIKLGVKV
jgi:hypothetical protein